MPVFGLPDASSFTVVARGPVASSHSGCSELLLASRAVGSYQNLSSRQLHTRLIESQHRGIQRPDPSGRRGHASTVRTIPPFKACLVTVDR